MNKYSYIEIVVRFKSKIMLLAKQKQTNKKNSTVSFFLFRKTNQKWLSVSLD